MALSIILSLVACGGEEITLESRTVNGLTFDVPSDIGEFSENAQIQTAANKDNTAVITISERIDAEGVTADLWDEEVYAATMIGGLEGAQLLEFSNSETVAGADTVYAHYTAKNSNGAEVEGYNYMFFFDDGTYQSLAFNFTKGSDTYLQKNLTTVINSIKE